MIENLSNAGVARQIALLLALRPVARALELHPLADHSIHRLPPEFRKQLGQAIAQYPMQEHLRLLQKDDTAEEDPGAMALCL